MRYRWHGPNGEKIEVERHMDDRDVPPTADELFQAGLELAPESMSRRPEAPVICKRHIPAMGTGGRMVTDPNFRDLWEAGQLEHELFDTADNKRAPIQKEIDRLKGKDNG